MENFRALPLHPIDGAGVTHLSITAMQDAPFREPLRRRAISSDESDESDGSEGERTAVHPSERDVIDEVALPVIERAERPRAYIMVLTSFGDTK